MDTSPHKSDFVNVNGIRLFLDCLHIDQAILVQHTNEGIELPHFAALYPERVLKLVFLEPAWDRNLPEFKAMMETWLKIDNNVEYPVEIYDNFHDFTYHQNKNYPANAASWCEARDEDLRHQMMISPEGKVVYKSAAGISKARETMFGYSPEFPKIRAPVLSIFPIRDDTYYVLPFMTKEQQAQMIEFYYAAQLPWFRHCIEQFRRDVPHAKIVELPHSHTYCFITQEDLVYHEMRMFLLDL